MQSDTPRTDAQDPGIPLASDPKVKIKTGAVPAEFARQLERDLSKAVALLWRYRDLSPQPAELYLDVNEFLNILNFDIFLQSRNLKT